MISASTALGATLGLESSHKLHRMFVIATISGHDQQRFWPRSCMFQRRKLVERNLCLPYSCFKRTKERIAKSHATRLNLRLSRAGARRASTVIPSWAKRNESIPVLTCEMKFPT